MVNNLPIAARADVDTDNGGNRQTVKLPVDGMLDLGICHQQAKKQLHTIV